MLKQGEVSLEEGSSIGHNAVVLYDSKLEKRAQLGNLSLLLKGETLPASSVWNGIPAQYVTQHEKSPAASYS